MHSDFTARFAFGLEQFNRRQFFESHETWEEIWLAASEPDKTFLQGIIQVAAGFHHATRGNRAGAESLVRAGLKKLEGFPEVYWKLRLEALRADVRQWLAVLAENRSLENVGFPQMQREQ